MAEPTDLNRSAARQLVYAILQAKSPTEETDAAESALAQAREEGRQEPKNLAEAERTYHDAHVVMKQRHGGDRDGEVSYYAVGPVRETLEEADLDLENFLALTEDA